MTVTTGFQMNRPVNPARARWENRVTGFVSPLIDLKSLAAVSEHLRHEWHSIQLAIALQRAQDFFLTSDLDPVPCLESRGHTQMRILRLAVVVLSCLLPSRGNLGARPECSDMRSRQRCLSLV